MCIGWMFTGQLHKYEDGSKSSRQQSRQYQIEYYLHYLSHKFITASLKKQYSAPTPALNRRQRRFP